MLHVWANKKLGASMNMLTGSLNSDEPCVFQSHQSRDYLLKSAPSGVAGAGGSEERSAETHASENAALKPAPTLPIGWQTLPKILD